MRSFSLVNYFCEWLFFLPIFPFFRFLPPFFFLKKSLYVLFFHRILLNENIIGNLFIVPPFSTVSRCECCIYTLTGFRMRVRKHHQTKKKKKRKFNATENTNQKSNSSIIIRPFFDIGLTRPWT